MRQKNQTSGGKPISDVEHLQELQNEKDFLWSVKKTFPTNICSISPLSQRLVAVMNFQSDIRKSNVNNKTNFRLDSSNKG